MTITTTITDKRRYFVGIGPVLPFIFGTAFAIVFLTEDTALNAVFAAVFAAPTTAFTAEFFLMLLGTLKKTPPGAGDRMVFI